MEAYLNRNSDPNHWEEVDEYARAKMTIALDAMKRQNARRNAQISPEIGIKVLLPVKKSKGVINTLHYTISVMTLIYIIV